MAIHGPGDIRLAVPITRYGALEASVLGGVAEHNDPIAC